MRYFPLLNDLKLVANSSGRGFSAYLLSLQRAPYLKGVTKEGTKSTEAFLTAEN